MPGLSCRNSGLTIRRHGNECSLWHGFPLPTASLSIPAALGGGDWQGLLPPVVLWEALTSDFSPVAASCLTWRNAKCFKTLSFLLGAGAWGQSQCLTYIRQAFYLWTPPLPQPGQGHPITEWNWCDNFFGVTDSRLLSQLPIVRAEDSSVMFCILTLNILRRHLMWRGEKIAIVTVCTLESVWNVLEVHSLAPLQICWNTNAAGIARHLHFPKHSVWFWYSLTFENHWSEGPQSKVLPAYRQI